MLPTPGPGDSPITIRYTTPSLEHKELSIEEKKQALETFKATSQPQTLLQPPNTLHKIDEAERTLVRANSIILKQGGASQENMTRRIRLTNNIKRLATFAKEHPWLTTGFVIALLLVLISGYITVSAFMGHTTLALFHAHPVIGGGLTFMTLYYSIYLINLCRRAAIKDDLERKIHSHNDYLKQLKELKEVDLKEMSHNLNKEIIQLSEELIETEIMLQSSQTVINEQLANAQSSLEKIKTYQTQLDELKAKHYSNMSEIQKKRVDEAINKAAEAVSAGSQIQMTERLGQQLPLTPQIAIDEAMIEFPPEETEMMKLNQQKQRGLIEKMGAFLTDIGPFMKKHPGTMVMIGGGIGICLLSGVAIYFYLHGASTLFFFGSLSLVTTTSIAVYGLSLIYEGYNNSTIQILRETIDEIEKADEARKEALSKTQARLQKIREHAAGTFKEFASQWAEFHKTESAYLHDTIQREKQMRPFSETEIFCRLLLEILQAEFPSISSQEVTHLVENYQKGALQ